MIFRKTFPAYAAGLFVMLFYGYGAAVELNMLLDVSGTKQMKVPIISRDYGFRGRYLTFEVTLAPWGTKLRNNRNSLSWNTYVDLRRQPLACVNSGPGALGFGWYAIKRCRD